MPKSKIDYAADINRAIDHIEQNINRKLDLRQLARVACFSPYHFHRLFSAFVGETPTNYVRRLRLEKAGMRLRSNPQESITRIAHSFGFSSSQTFARDFKYLFKLSPSQYRKNCNIKSKIRKDFAPNISYNPVRQQLSLTKSGKGVKFMDIEIKQMPKMAVAYVRHSGAYDDMRIYQESFKKLMTWAMPQKLFGQGSLCLSVYHDDPDITDEKKLRLDVCITVPENTKGSGAIQIGELPAGKYAVARFVLANTHEAFKKAWDSIYREWLPKSGMQLDSRPSYEIYRNNPDEGKSIVDICVPVK